LDSIGKKLRKQDPTNERFKAIKWLLYKAWKDLNFKQRTTLLKAFRLSPTLRKAYFLKIELQNIFDIQMDKTEAEQHINTWIQEAQSLAHQAMDKFLKTFHTWKNDIFTHRGH
jgi:transposase